MKNATSSVALGLLTATLCTVPLALAPGLHAFDITPKLLALVGGAALVWLCLAASGDFAATPRVLALLAACGVLATLFSRDRVLSLVGTDWRRMGLPAWLACVAIAAAIPAVAGDSAFRRRVLRQAIAAAGVIAAVYGMFQYAGRDPWINAALYHIGEGEWQTVRPPSTFGYVSYFALYLAAAVYVAVGLALDASSIAEKFGWAGGAVLMTLALLITGSRGAWIGAVGGLIVLMVQFRQRRQILLGLLSAVAIGALFMASPAAQPVRSRVRWFVEDSEGGGRLHLWPDSLRLGMAHPIFGTGLETFGREFALIETDATARIMRDFYVESPHNVFLDYLTSAGFPAVVCFVVLVGMALRSREPHLVAALVAGMLAAQFVADTIPTRLLLMSLAGMAIPPTAARRWPAVVRGVIAMAAVASLGLWLVYGVRLARADRAFYLAEQAARVGNLDQVIEKGRVAQTVYPFEYSQLVGQIAVAPNLAPGARGFLFSVAEDSARQALAHSERPHQVHLQLASIAAVEGRIPVAKSELEEAIRCSPSWELPRKQLSFLLGLDTTPHPGR